MSAPVAAAIGSPRGGLIDRSPAALASRSTASAYRGHAGDTLASALLANGVPLVGRSFKYHRPRGILTAGPEEPNALVELRTGARREPNTKATHDRAVRRARGARARIAGRRSRFDLWRVNQLFSPLFVARLLLQDFHVAGILLGEALRADDPARRRPWPRSGLPDPDRYEKRARASATSS